MFFRTLNLSGTVTIEIAKDLQLPQFFIKNYTVINCDEDHNQSRCFGRGVCSLFSTLFYCLKIIRIMTTKHKLYYNGFEPESFKNFKLIIFFTILLFLLLETFYLYLQTTILIRFSFKTLTTHVITAEGAFPCLNFRFILKRDIGYFLIQVYVPSILIGDCLEWMCVVAEELN